MKKIICKGSVIDFLPLYIIKNGVAYIQKNLEEKYNRQFLRDFEEDFPYDINESGEVKRNLIKRYRNIVDKLKAIYHGNCQICEKSFIKENGENYSEAHHLIPLSKGGTQKEDNVIIICANHHRMLHYAKEVKIDDRIGNLRSIKINGDIFFIKY